ncbi:hypothetical protein XENTR_v10005078 [Xenopus tropicalis]|nr:hypothetical protein XENTR_v10005078 [Xenopus tropicalis]
MFLECHYITGNLKLPYPLSMHFLYENTYTVFCIFIFIFSICGLCPLLYLIIRIYIKRMTDMSHQWAWRLLWPSPE